MTSNPLEYILHRQRRKDEMFQNILNIMMKLAESRRQQGQWEQEHDLSERRTSAYEKQFEPKPILKPWEQEGFSSQEEQVGHAAKMYPERFDMGVKPYAPTTPEEWADKEKEEQLKARFRESNKTSPGRDMLLATVKRLDALVDRQEKTPAFLRSFVGGGENVDELKRARAMAIELLDKVDSGIPLTKTENALRVKLYQQLSPPKEQAAPTATPREAWRTEYDALKAKYPTLTEEQFLASYYKSKQK